MALHHRPTRRRSEPMIALINIVFLMLVFFLLTSAVAPPLDAEVRLVDTTRLEGRAPPDAAVLRADGSLWFRGAEITFENYLAQRLSEQQGGVSVRLVPDREAPAERLVEVAAELRRAGAVDVWVVTERGLE